MHISSAVPFLLLASTATLAVPIVELPAPLSSPQQSMLDILVRIGLKSEPLACRTEGGELSSSPYKVSFFSPSPHQSFLDSSLEKKNSFGHANIPTLSPPRPPPETSISQQRLQRSFFHSLLTRDLSYLRGVGK